MRTCGHVEARGEHEAGCAANADHMSTPRNYTHANTASTHRRQARASNQHTSYTTIIPGYRFNVRLPPFCATGPVSASC